MLAEESKDIVPEKVLRLSLYRFGFMNMFFLMKKVQRCWASVRSSNRCHPSRLPKKTLSLNLQRKQKEVKRKYVCMLLRHCIFPYQLIRTEHCEVNVCLNYVFILRCIEGRYVFQTLIIHFCMEISYDGNDISICSLIQINFTIPDFFPL